MANSRDRRPSDYELPSTDDVIHRIRKGKDKQLKTRHVVVSKAKLTSDKDHAVDVDPPVLSRALVVRDWILVGLVCLILTLQVYDIMDEMRARGTPEEERHDLGTPGEEQSIGEPRADKTKEADNGP